MMTLAANVPPSRDWVVEGFPEGRRLYRLHSARERNSKLIRDQKKLAHAKAAGGAERRV